MLHLLLFQIPDLKILKAVAFTNHLHFNGDFSFGKSQNSQGAKSKLLGG
jgi:hypothetical protein